MNEIWVISTKEKGCEALIRQLKCEGYMLRSLCLKTIGFQALDSSLFQVAVFIIHPESSSDWTAYQDFKRFFPDCLVFIYMPHHPLTNLTSALCQSITRYAHLEKRRIRERSGKAEAEGMLL